MHACRTSILLALCCGIALFALPGTALAKGGRYVFDGGTQVERTQVRAALEASTFDWNIVPGQITIHLQQGPSQAAPGQMTQKFIVEGRRAKQREKLGVDCGIVAEHVDSRGMLVAQEKLDRAILCRLKAGRTS